jgi:hypothetical protein
MWVTTWNNVVTKVQVSDGAALGTFAVGSTPQSVAFDGANIWVANYGSNTVIKLRASDGALLGTFWAGGSYPNGIAFDGIHIWISNLINGTASVSYNHDNRRAAARTGTPNPSWPLPAANQLPLPQIRHHPDVALHCVFAEGEVAAVGGRNRILHVEQPFVQQRHFAIERYAEQGRVFRSPSGREYSFSIRCPSHALKIAPPTHINIARRLAG